MIINFCFDYTDDIAQTTYIHLFLQDFKTIQNGHKCPANILKMLNI